MGRYGGPVSSAHCNLKKHKQTDKTQGNEENKRLQIEKMQQNFLHFVQHAVTHVKTQKH